MAEGHLCSLYSAAMHHTLKLSNYLSSITASALAPWADGLAWDITSQSESIVKAMLAELSPEEFLVTGEVAIHKTATVEAGAVLKGPLIVGARNFIAAGAYLRGGCWLDEDCIIGPSCELKSSFLFKCTKLAHFNFAGDSIIGERVNIEAGAIICNYRNERPEADIRVRIAGVVEKVEAVKFGALVGDGVRLGANSVVAPGALLRPGAIVGRTMLCDQEQDMAGG